MPVRAWCTCSQVHKIAGRCLRSVVCEGLRLSACARARDHRWAHTGWPTRMTGRGLCRLWDAICHNPHMFVGACAGQPSTCHPIPPRPQIITTSASGASQPLLVSAPAGTAGATSRLAAPPQRAGLGAERLRCGTHRRRRRPRPPLRQTTCPPCIPRPTDETTTNMTLAWSQGEVLPKPTANISTSSSPVKNSANITANSLSSTCTAGPCTSTWRVSGSDAVSSLHDREGALPWDAGAQHGLLDCPSILTPPTHTRTLPARMSRSSRAPMASMSPRRGTQ